MRQGDNPSNHKAADSSNALHRVIIPIFIPHETEYFKDAFHIFELCLFSLKKTTLTAIKISVISNGSCDSVNEKLYKFFEAGDIDELIIEREGIGKINSVLKALKTAEERFITITDADVLFDDGWEQAVLDVFQAFPKAGAVCPTPVFRKHFQLTSNMWFKYFFSSKLKFTPVIDPESMTKFANSIGWPRLDEKFKDVMATLKANNGLEAMVGCSHFVATYKREAFEQIPQKNSEFKIRGNSEYLYTDLPVIKQGGYRLSTVKNHAFHMGNVLEDWMEIKYKSLKNRPKAEVGAVFSILKPPLIGAVFTEACFKWLLAKKGLKRHVLKKKGLNNAQVKNFME
tara:strand:- start:131144 stop:132169 length:1026 start_codon:yes stop_codon:yes gene_type:complete